MTGSGMQMRSTLRAGSGGAVLLGSFRAGSSGLAVRIVAEKSLDFLLDILFAHQAHVLGVIVAIAVHDESHRQAGKAAEQIGGLILRDDHRERFHFVLLHKWFDHLGPFIVDVYGEHFKTFRSVALL